MNKDYRIQFLDDSKFEALSIVNPRYANTKDDLGFADMKTNRIFVRKTGIKPLDTFVTQHEIEEILAKNSSHEDEFNIRHKRGSQIVRTIAPIVGGILGGPLLGGLVGSTLGVGSTMASAIGGGIGSTVGSVASQTGTGQRIDPLSTGLSAVGGALGGAGMGAGIEASKAAGGGLVGQTLSGAQSMLGFQPGAQRAMQPTPLTTAFQTSQATNPALGSSVNFGGTPQIITGGASRGLTAAAAPIMTSMPAALGLGFGKGNAGISTGVTSNPQATQPLNSTPLSGAFKESQDIAFGAPRTGSQAAQPVGISTGATGGMGTVGGETAKTISKTPMLEKLLGENWRQTILGASIPLLAQPSMFGAAPTLEPFTPEQSQLFQETAQMVRQGAQVQLTPNQSQAIATQYDDALEQAKQNIMDRYKALRPGSDIENDSQFREAIIELESDFGEKKANALAGAQLGLSQQQTQMMSELAAMEIYSLAMKAGISYQEAAQFKDMLGQIGFMVAKSGQPVIQVSR